MPTHQHTRAAGTQNNPEMRKRTGPYGDDVSLLLSGVSRDRLIDERELVANAPCILYVSPQAALKNCWRSTRSLAHHASLLAFWLVEIN